jgi:UrcA family protein
MRVIKHGYPRRDVMNTFTTARAARPRAKFALLMLGGLAGILAAGAAGAANAAGDVPTIVVKYDAASLATDGGVNELYRRITYAAKRVCPSASIRDLTALRQVDECRNQAISRAIRQIDNSQLAALYASYSKNG